MTQRIRIDDFLAAKTGAPIYAIGLADNLVTIRSQQLRALCLAELLHSNTKTPDRKNVAIIGGGIAGLTLSARLLQLGWTDIRIFERLTDILAVQNGCDTRSIHPRIIDWPKDGSTSDYSNLSILNWTTDTASNVSYKIEHEWNKILQNCVRKPKDADGRLKRGKFTRIISVLLGVTHLKISMKPRNKRGRKRIKDFPEIEWIRDTTVLHRKIDGDTALPSGQRAFSKVILATGFGIETGAHDSYWRNESLGQLNIDGAQRRFLVSGLGDGAVSDLLRLTTKNFRPDRALRELNPVNLAKYLNSVKSQHLLKTLELLGTRRTADGLSATQDLDKLIEYFADRKRDDTYVVLHALGQQGFRDAFRRSTASTLNKVFLYALYKNGAFQYIESEGKGSELDVARSRDIPVENVIRRHGVDRRKVVADLFSSSHEAIHLKQQPTDSCEEHIKAYAAYQKLTALLTALCQLKQVNPQPLNFQGGAII